MNFDELWNHHQFQSCFFPECVARVPVSLWGSGSGGWGCVRSTLRLRPQPSATVRNRLQPSATVCNRPWGGGRMAVPMVSFAKGVTFRCCRCRVASIRVAGVALRHIQTRFVTFRKWFCVAGAIPLRRFQKMSSRFRDRRSTLDVILVIERGRRSTLDVSCCVFCANRIVRAASSGDKGSDKVQIPWQAWRFVRCDENWRKPCTKHRFWGSKFAGWWEKLVGKLRVWSFKKCENWRKSARNARSDAPTCLISSLWLSCGQAASMGEAAKPLLFEGFQAGCHVVLRGRRVTLWHSNLSDNVSKVVLCGRRNTFASFSQDELQFSWQAQHFGDSTLDTPYSTPFTLHTPHATLHTPHFTFHTLHSTLYTVHFTLHTLHSTLHTLHSTLHTLHFTLYSLYTNASAFSRMRSKGSRYTPHFTLQTLHFTLYTSHFTLHTLHATFFHIPQSTVHWYGP